MKLSLTNKIVLIVLTALLSSCLYKQTSKKEESTITLEKTTEILSALAHDSLKGRKPGTEGHLKASEFIVKHLKEVNISPFYKSYLDSFSYHKTQTFNTIGLLGNKDRTHSHVLLSAHLDHLGTIRPKAEKDSIFNGANDNTSGATAVLQIAKALSEDKVYDNFNIIICFFSGEEDGLMGSKYLSKKFKEENVNLKYVMNFDMLGTAFTGNTGEVFATGYRKSNLGEVLNSVSDSTLVHYFPEEKRYGLFYRSDNYPFYKELGVPSHTLSTFDFNNFDYYHEVKDEVQFVDVKNLNTIINRVYSALKQILREDESRILLTQEK